MKIGVLGTGMVGNTLGSRLVQLGHQVMMGSRTANNEKAAAWVANHGALASQGTFADAAAFGELLLNCTKGQFSLDVLNLAGEDNLNGKVLIDISNSLDFSKGMPPTLSVCNDDSLGEQIQKAFPKLKVVKSLNTLNAALMAEPQKLASGDHDIFVCGNDADAKKQVTQLLNQMGWDTKHIIDLGDITNARGTEQLLPIWVRLYGTFGTPMFQFKIVR